MNRVLRTAIFLVIFFTASACTSLSPFEQQYYNDPEMTDGAGFTEQSELNFQSYREGARGAKGSKGGGGCGCF